MTDDRNSKPGVGGTIPSSVGMGLLGLFVLFLVFCIIGPKIPKWRVAALHKSISVGMPWHRVAEELERSRWDYLSFYGSRDQCPSIWKEKGKFLFSPPRNVRKQDEMIPIPGLSDPLVMEHIRNCPELRVEFQHGFMSLATEVVGFRLDSNGVVNEVGEPRHYR